MIPINIEIISSLLPVTPNYLMNSTTPKTIKANVRGLMMKLPRSIILLSVVYGPIKPGSDVFTMATPMVIIHGHLA